MLTDLKFAFRQLAKSPGFTAVAVLKLNPRNSQNAAGLKVLELLLGQSRLFENCPEGAGRDVRRVHGDIGLTSIRMSQDDVGPGLSADYKSRSLQSCQNLTRLVRHLRRVPEWKRKVLRARIPIRGWRAFRLSTASAGLARPRVRLQYQVRGSSSQAMECARSRSLPGSLNPGCAQVGSHSSYKNVAIVDRQIKSAAS